MNDVGSKLPCLGSCWSYVATFLATTGCQDGHLGDQERQDEPRWRPRGGQMEVRWHRGLGDVYKRQLDRLDGDLGSHLAANNVAT